jgi:hypothetical protein
MTFADRRVQLGAKELRDLARTYRASDGMLVNGRCFSIRHGARVRYEILIDGFGEYALADVARLKEVPARMEQAMRCFAASCRLAHHVPLPTR